MTTQEAQEFAERLLSLLKTKHGSGRLFWMLKKEWSKVRNYIARDRYQDAINELDTIILFARAIRKWCEAKRKGD